MGGGFVLFDKFIEIHAHLEENKNPQVSLSKDKGIQNKTRDQNLKKSKNIKK